MRSAVMVVFRCNDQFGTFEGCARSVEVENVIDLEAISMVRPPRLAFIPFDGAIRMIRISGRSFPVLKHRVAVGNLAHSAVLMETPVAAELLNFLKSKGSFAAEGGEIPASDPWFGDSARFSARALEEAYAE